MKRKMALLMAVVCLVFWDGGITTFAAGGEYINFCSNCGAALRSSRQHLDHWTVVHVFKDNQGNSITCYEYHSIDRNVKDCPNGHGVFWADKEEETVHHSVEQCPGNK